MKRSFFLLFVILSNASSLLAQPRLQVIGSAGNYFSSPIGSLSFTVGEPMTNTFSSSASVLTQGFQQPLSFDTTTGIRKIISNNFSAKLYPNPAIGFINLDIVSENSDYTVNLFDLLGQKLSVSTSKNKSSANTMHFILDLRSLATGSYFIIAREIQGAQTHTFKFTKTN